MNWGEFDLQDNTVWIIDLQNTRPCRDLEDECEGLGIFEGIVHLGQLCQHPYLHHIQACFLANFTPQGVN